MGRSHKLRGLKEMGLRELQERRKKAIDDEKNASDRKQELDQMISKADRLERTTGRSGAIPMTPKADLLNTDEIQEAHPDKHFRFVNVSDDQKVQSRAAQGYKRVPSAEGGKVLGKNLALFAQDKAIHEERVAAVKQLNKERLESHRSEVEQVVEAVARELRDRHGIQVDAKRLMDV